MYILQVPTIFVVTICFFHIKINQLYSLRVYSVPREIKINAKRGFYLFFFIYMIKILVRFISVDRLSFERYFRLTKI